MAIERKNVVSVKSKGKKLIVEDLGEKGKSFTVEYETMGIPMSATITLDKETVNELCKAVSDG